MNNSEQLEYWNGPAGERWAEFQETLDGVMRQITPAAMAFAAAKPGERVLDVGCGCGTTTKLLADAVGLSGNVTGVDISRPMLARARQRGIAANFLEADASEHLFKATHDLVFSRFGVMFFAEPVAAFANLRKAVAPHGRMAFVCWAPPAENLWASAPLAVALPYLPVQEPADPYAPGPFALADAARLKDILSQAGFGQVRIEGLKAAMVMGATLEDAVEQTLKIGPLARAAAGLDPAALAVIRQAVASALGRYAGADGIAPPAACWLVEARA